MGALVGGFIGLILGYFYGWKERDAFFTGLKCPQCSWVTLELFMGKRRPTQLLAGKRVSVITEPLCKR